MRLNTKVIYETKTPYAHYSVVDEVYNGHPARVLYTHNRTAAQSAITLDKSTELLFNYNERFMEIVRESEPKSLLLIGGGAFTLAKAILEEFPLIQLDVVELDGKLVDVATKYFGFKPTPDTNVHIVDGLEYLRKNSKQYELVIIDVFQNEMIPESFQQKEAFKLISKATTPNGIMAMNVISAYHGLRSALLKRLIDIVQIFYEHIELFPASKSMSYWIPDNYVLTAHNVDLNISNMVGFNPLIAS